MTQSDSSIVRPTLPAEEAEALAVETPNGTHVAVYAWREWPEGAPVVLWGHANGFNAGCYRPFLRTLAAHARVFAYDARGHGASGKPSGDLRNDYAMLRFGEDLSAIADTVRARIGPDAPLHYGSHSLGGIAAAMLEGRLDRHPFASLTLFEPPIYPPEGHEARPIADQSQPLFIKWSARRQDRFADRDELREVAARISTFRTFAPEMLEAYVDAVVEPDADGGLRLRCPRDIESAVYTNCPPAGVFEAITGIRTPARVYSADPETVDAGHLWTPSTMKSVAEAMADAEYRAFPRGQHLMVQEHPERAVAELLDHIAAVAAR